MKWWNNEIDNLILKLFSNYFILLKKEKMNKKVNKNIFNAI